jgi:hypothetical protein
MSTERRIEKLEHFWHARTMTWAEALRLADGILQSCAWHCDTATTAAIAGEFESILATHRQRKVTNNA